MDPDILMTDTDVRHAPGTQHFVVAIDFGTTFSSVAYVGFSHKSQRKRIGLQQIDTIDRYPYSPYGGLPNPDVPTEIWYSQRIARPVTHDNAVVDRQPPEDDSSSGDNDDRASDTGTPSSSILKLNQLSSALSHADDERTSLFWGFGVQDQLLEADYDTDHSRHLSRFKLILDESEHTQQVRNSLSETCKTLRKMLLINEDIDVIADYLEHLLRHTKKRLIDSNGYTAASTVEYVLCIPAVWKAEAIRQMQIAMTTAVGNSGLGKLQHGSIDNLFVVSEPEGAAACLLASNKTRLNIGDTFILLDAGGGTVDAITYTMDQGTPLRLKTEEVTPGGATCGSSFINERFGELLLERLKNGALYLENGGESLSTIIAGLVVEFERRDKRRLDGLLLQTHPKYHIKVPGLKLDPKLRFEKGRLLLTHEEMERLFLPSLDGVAQVMKKQLDMTLEKGCEVQKIILMGGFGQSESLSVYLRKFLATMCGSAGQQVVFETSKLPSSAVACGAVLRALRKEEGPARILQSSYGFIRTELYGEDEAHASQSPTRDNIDNLDYIDNTIDWIINKDETLVSEHRISKKIEYTFAYSRKKLLGAEYLYVSDRRHESHYRLGHLKNEGAVQAGKVEVDMTFLKTSGKIKPEAVPGKFPCWKIRGTLWIYVSGRNLRYEVHLDGNVEGVGQTCIAAAFKPGTE